MDTLCVAPRVTCDIWGARLCRSRWSDELRKQFYGCISSGRRLYRPYSQGRQARGPAGGAGIEVRAGDQQSNRADARPHRAAVAPRYRRRGDRMMRRREFITLMGGAAAAWPLAARAQQADRMRRIGVLSTLPADDPEWQARLAALLQGLQELGWTVGRNVRIDYR